MIIGPYTISRGSILPYDETTQTRQHRSEADDGSVGVVDDWDFDLIKVKIVVKRPEALNVRGFLKNGQRFAAIPFTITDDYGTSFFVRLWDKRILLRTQKSGSVEMVMIFRQEVL